MIIGFFLCGLIIGAVIGWLAYARFGVKKPDIVYQAGRGLVKVIYEKSPITDEKVKQWQEKYKDYLNYLRAEHN